ncbi:MAG: hypothetical protein PHZ19_11480 [Candidatus Thermoplasmatota archaeon]|nr:hypothetical protein [Candidatus Thermoplasmatota archaeon]
MKKAIVLMAVVLFSALAMGQTTLTLSDYWVYWMTPQGTVLGGFTSGGNFATRGNVAVGNDLTVAGATTLSGALGITGDMEVTGDLAVDGTTVVLDGSTSVRGISAGFTSLEAPAIRFGVDSSIYMEIAVSDTTGNVAITHTGTAKAVSWTAAGGFGFVGDTAVTGTLLASGAITSGVNGATGTAGGLTINNGANPGAAVFTVSGATGNLMADGATISLDGSTSVRGISAGFVSLESTDIRFGANATEYMKVAVVATTGATTISHEGSAPTVDWTADSFGLTGATTITGNLTANGTVHGIYAPNVRIGYSSSIYTDFAVDDTTGDLTITHAGGTAGNVDWTAAAFAFTGDTTITGDLDVDGAIYHTGATNSGALMVSSNTLAYTDTTAKNLFVLPANAIVTDVVVVVTTACNGDGTHQLSVGITGATTKWVNALDVKTAPGVFRMGSSAAMPYAGIGTVGATDVTVIGSIPASGTAGDAGSVTVYIYWYLAP